MKNFILHSIIGCFILFSCTKNASDSQVYIIPEPSSIQYANGNFILNNETTLFAENGLDVQKALLNEFIIQTKNPPLNETEHQQKNQIQLTLNNSLKKEEYILKVTPQNIIVEGSDEQAILWGIQTLRQVIVNHPQNSFPSLIIKDQPRFAYRGMHLDVGRHLFPVTFIKKYIDILSLHKINTFHWHLTEDQGWRIEIKKYPKLTSIGGYRNGTVVGHHGSSNTYDGKRYGGFYTQEEVKEIVQYAKERGMQVIPEIELPGHALAALSSYPEFGCTGGPYEAAQTFGVFEDVYCAGNDDTYSFLEDIIDEILPLFPSEYIHIGGDECPKSQWKKCPKCQKRIKDEGLNNEHELQSYFVQRMEKYINGKGKRMIGWDEILEGGLAPNATVMSWRGTEGGIAAAKEKHEVIMTPGNFVYFDHYQNEDIENEPMAVGGYTSVKEVYGYEPIPSSLSTEEQKYIIGVQGNVWTEYMKTGQKVEYMLVPRITALSEIAWSTPDHKNWESFKNRLNYIQKLYDLMNINYATHLFNVVTEIKADTTSRDLVATLETTSPSPIYYTLDGTIPTNKSLIYKEPIHINKSLTLKATTISGKVYSERSINFHKGAFKELELLSSTDEKYFTKGSVPLHDGLRGSLIYNSGTWVGFNHGDFKAVIDLSKSEEISTVIIGTLIKKKKGIFGPKEISIYTSIDGEKYDKVATKKGEKTTQETSDGITDFKLDFSPLQARYIKIEIDNYGSLPKWHSLKGKEAYIFLDEIIIE